MNESTIRPCNDGDRATLLAIINDATAAYEGAIPSECFHRPYMSMADLDREIRAGVEFFGYARDGLLIGIMGIQRVQDVDLIRHAYVRSEHQGHGAGGALLRYLEGASARQILVGTWAGATWAIAFYQRNGFALASSEVTPALLRQYWSISDHQAEASVVLTKPSLETNPRSLWRSTRQP